MVLVCGMYDEVSDLANQKSLVYMALREGRTLGMNDEI